MFTNCVPPENVFLGFFCFCVWVRFFFFSFIKMSVRNNISLAVVKLNESVYVKH